MYAIVQFFVGGIIVLFVRLWMDDDDSNEKKIFGRTGALAL